MTCWCSHADDQHEASFLAPCTECDCELFDAEPEDEDSWR